MSRHLLGKRKVTSLTEASGIWNIAEQAKFQLDNIWAGFDRYFSQVVLLLHGNGTNGSTTFTDSSSSAKTVTTYSGAQISTAQSKFGGASLYFDGVDDYATVPNHADFQFGSGAFTIEFFLWAEITLNSIYWNQIVGRWLGNNGASDDSWGVYINGDTGALTFVYADGNVKSVSTTATAIYNDATEHHIAITYDQTTFRVFVDGSLVGSSVDSVTINNGVGDLTIGRTNYRNTNFVYQKCYIDELRITKGVARYTANFDPPISQFLDH